MREKSFYVVKSIKMMSYLIRDGFSLYKVEDDERNPHYKVFLFEDSPKLRKSITKFSNKSN